MTDAWMAATTSQKWEKATDRAYRRRAIAAIERAAMEGHNAVELMKLHEEPSPCVREYFEERGFRVGEPTHSSCWARLTWPKLTGPVPSGRLQA